MISGDFLIVRRKFYFRKNYSKFYKSKPEYILTYSTEGGKINYMYKKMFGKLIYQKDEISYKYKKSV